MSLSSVLSAVYRAVSHGRRMYCTVAFGSWSRNAHDIGNKHSWFKELKLLSEWSGWPEEFVNSWAPKHMFFFTSGSYGRFQPRTSGVATVCSRTEIFPAVVEMDDFAFLFRASSCITQQTCFSDTGSFVCPLLLAHFDLVIESFCTL